jgi:predicted XRE-type DNA-binding protein
MSVMATANSNREPLRRRSPTLTFEHAVEVWKRRILGESQHHIAQSFGVNQGRVSEVLKERRHVGSRLVAHGQNRPDAPKGNAKN